MASTNSPLFIAGLIIILISAVTNFFLVYFASKIKKKSPDVILILVMASIELIIPVTKIAMTVHSSITGINITGDPIGCQGMGVYVSFFFMLDTMLNFLLAKLRFAIVSDKPLSKYFTIPLISTFMVYPILVICVAAGYEMVVYPTGIICFVDPKKSILSFITFYYFIFYTSTCTCLMIYTYIKLSRKVMKTFEFVDLELRATNNGGETKASRIDYKIASIKVYLTMTSNAAFILGSCIFLIIVNYTSNTNVFMANLRLYLDFLTIFFFITGIASNSLLVMLLHTGISNEVTNFINKFKKKQ